MFVERERRLRGVVEARMEQAIEDAAALREWAATQVSGVRQDIEHEVELLLNALSLKTAALEDVHARLETRVRWGVALLEAKKAAVLGRRVLQAWRAVAARAKYCRNVAAKLQERAAIRKTAHLMATWADYCIDQRLRRQRMRAAVRRMAFLKMQNVLLAWKDTVDERVAEESAEESALRACQSHLRQWQLRQLMGRWRERSRRASVATALLQGMAARCDENSMQHVFTAWQEHVLQQKLELACFQVKAAANRRRAALGAALDAWRVSVDDTFGGQLQMVHAQRVISRRRGVRALQAWRGVVETAKGEALRWHQIELFERRRRASRVMLAWREFTFESKDNRDVFVRFIHARAERRMQMVMVFWRAYAAWKRHAACAVHHAVQRKALHGVTSALSLWREETARGKVNRHRVAVCQRRQRSEMMQAALVALRQHAAETIQEREMEQKAAGWHAGRLQARALWALVEGVQQHREFAGRLMSVAAQVDKTQLKAAWEVWQQVAGQEKALQVAVYRFQVRRAWFAMKSGFAAWKKETQQAQHEATLLARGTARLQASRACWAFSVWRHVSAEAVDEQRAVAFGQRRMARLRLAASFSAWRRYSEWSLAVQETVEEAVQQRKQRVATACVDIWAAYAVQCSQQRTRLELSVSRQAASLQAAAFSSWRTRTQFKVAQQAQLCCGVARLSRIRLENCVAAWRRLVDDVHGERTRLGAVGLTLAMRHQELVLKRLFTAWRGRTTEVAASLAAGEARRGADAAAVLRCAFSSWRNFANNAALRREHFVAALVERRREKQQALVYAGWRYQSQQSARNAIVVLHRVERAATGVCRSAFDTWRSAAKERRQRRTALVRFMQRTNASRASAAFAVWRSVVAEKTAATEELRRCLLRKKIAFTQFKQWYWDSFDEDLQATLRAMFEFETEEFAALEDFGGHHRQSHHLGGGEDEGEEALLMYGSTAAGAASGSGASSIVRQRPSPVKSLLSSPIRRELEQSRSGGSVAVGGTQQHHNSNNTSNDEDVVKKPFSTNQSHPLLSAKVHAALAAAQLSPAPPVPHAPAASECTAGSAVLGGLVDWFAPGSEMFVTHPSGMPPLSPVFETNESWYGDDAQSPLAAPSHISSSQASTVATTGFTTKTVITAATPHSISFDGVLSPSNAVGRRNTTTTLSDAKTPWSTLAAAGVSSSAAAVDGHGGFPAAAMDFAVTPKFTNHFVASSEKENAM